MYNFEDNTIILEDGTIESILDKEKYPLLENTNLEDVFFMDTLDDKYREKNFDYYNFNGLPVPRVSHILKECIGKEYLMIWAAKLGYKEMIAARNKATTIGSFVHEMIEHYLLHGEDLDISYKVSPYYLPQIMIAYNNFKDWVIYINSLGFFIEEIIAIEYVVVCPLYGGTIDCILRINGKVYIIDFKTSKQISYEYILQTCSYMWIINNGYYPNLPYIDGIGIIRIDKESKKFEDLFLNNHIPEQKNIIDYYINAFSALLSSYYNNINVKQLFSRYKKIYKIEEVL